MLSQAVAWLAADWAGNGPLDLSRVGVIVPTRQSGRRLREALAVHAAAKKQAVFPPRVLLPETLVSGRTEAGVASQLEVLLAWVEVLAAIELAAFRAVFPLDPPVRNFAWASRLAQTLVHLQATLAEVGLRLGDVAARLGPENPESARWKELGELEHVYLEELGRRGWQDPQIARIQSAATAAVVPDIERIVLLAVADPLPLTLQYLVAQSPRIPVDVVVFAPPTEANQFDGWGRPLPEVWKTRELPIPAFRERVHLCPDPAAQAERIAQLAREYPQPDGSLAIGVTDPEVAPLLVAALRRVDRSAFNPEGHSRRQEALFQVLGALAELARDTHFSAVENLARCPEFLGLLADRLGAEFSPARWLAELDRLRAQHLPADLAAARRQAAAGGLVANGLAIVDELVECLRRGDFGGSAAATLGRIFAARQLDFARAGDARLAAAASEWTELVRECAAAAAHFSRLTPAEWWELALRLYGEGRVTEEKAPGALELQGWLELLWEDAPHVVVAGLNEGRVPDAVVGDAFLPESLRVRLGLKSNTARLARDAYIFQAVINCRARADWLLGKTSAVGDPLRPSRLLLRCPDAELPERVAFLFRAPDVAQANVAWQSAWPLRPRRAELPTRIRVTALRDYLRCPFRFYLRHVLKMEPVEPQKTEMDAFDFGTLCHAALEQIGRQPALRDSTDPAWLKEGLQREFDRVVRERFGAKLTLPLLIQCESARQRLAKAAEVQARERAEGWVIEAVERPFAWEIGGLTVNGKIDRIERHAGTGAWRVLDYKTSDSAVSPATAHLGWWRPEEAPPDWAVVTIDDRRQVWADLQLPLYLQALSRETPGEWSAGYFNLPKAVGETGLVMWSDYTPELQAAAWRCIESVCAAIRAGKFWPPNETIAAERDNFAALFHHGVAASIAWEETT